MATYYHARPTAQEHERHRTIFALIRNVRYVVEKSVDFPRETHVRGTVAPHTSAYILALALAEGDFQCGVTLHISRNNRFWMAITRCNIESQEKFTSAQEKKCSAQK